MEGKWSRDALKWGWKCWSWLKEFDIAIGKPTYVVWYENSKILGRPGDSSSNTRLRRLNESVTVNLTRIQWD